MLLLAGPCTWVLHYIPYEVRVSPQSFERPDDQQAHERGGGEKGKRLFKRDFSSAVPVGAFGRSAELGHSGPNRSHVRGLLGLHYWQARCSADGPAVAAAAAKLAANFMEASAHLVCHSDVHTLTGGSLWRESTQKNAEAQ